MTFYETEFHDFPAPKREEVCFMEVNKKIRYQPPTRRVIKYHLSIIDLSFSNLYNYTIESEFAANYQNCSFYQEEDSLEVMVARFFLPKVMSHSVPYAGILFYLDMNTSKDILEEGF